VIAEAATKPGGSSIAVIADGARVSFVGSVIEARDAMPGENGEPYAAAAASGIDGNPGEMACSGGSVLGAEGPVNQCDDGSSVGGPGGNGSVAQGGPGGSGQPGEDVSMNGGAGEWDSMMCTPGQAGTSGTPGEPAKDEVKESGFINAVDGYVGVPGADGTAGKSGQGGGKGGVGGQPGAAPEEAQKLNAACAGGAGGDGGKGGDGAKGSPGHSIGIAYRMKAPPPEGADIQVGAPGEGGTAKPLVEFE
jgi:hypothetical protein